jgi:hypothetical protein
MSYRTSAGSAAANIYEEDSNSQLTIDWSFDDIYFKYRDNEWVTLSTDFAKINSLAMKRMFKSLALHAFQELEDHSKNATKALKDLRYYFNLLV